MPPPGWIPRRVDQIEALILIHFDYACNEQRNHEPRVDAAVRYLVAGEAMPPDVGPGSIPRESVGDEYNLLDGYATTAWDSWKHVMTFVRDDDAVPGVLRRRSCGKKRRSTTHNITRSPIFRCPLETCQEAAG